MANDKETEILLLIREINSQMRQGMQQMISETGFTAPQMMVMGLLKRNGSLKISQLSEKLNLSNSTISGIIDRLEKQNYVERKRSKEDRRVVRVSMTEKAQEVMHSTFYESIEQGLKKKLMQGSPEQTDVIIKGLEALKELMVN